MDILYETLSRLYEADDAESISGLLRNAVVVPLNQASKLPSPTSAGLEIKDEFLAPYRSFAFNFLASASLGGFEDAAFLSERIDIDQLATAIQTSYALGTDSLSSKADLLWLLAHFIGLGRSTATSNGRLTYLNALLAQLSFLSAEISGRIDIKASNEDANDFEEVEATTLPLPSYVSRQLLSLAHADGISNILQVFSSSLARSSAEAFQGTSILAGYILTLLHTFPSSADDTRMRLFREQVPAASGSIPIVKFLWRIMKKTAVFKKLHSESEPAVHVVRRYLQGTTAMLQETSEEQEWRVMLLFLELYIFVLRLSDDEDFLSGMRTLMDENSSSSSRLRECSLSLADVQALSTFLKNTAFVMHYKTQELSSTHQRMTAEAKSRLDSYLGAKNGATNAESHTKMPVCSTKMGLDGLRALVTAALKMIYERDSRQHFLPSGHWLMTDKLEREDFISAVIAEEARQTQEEADEDVDGSDGEDTQMTDVSGMNTGFHTTVAGQRLSRHARMERLRAQQTRAQRERRLAELGPKLEILKHMPFVVPFDTRVKIFRAFIDLDIARRDTDTHHGFHFARYHARIRRDQLFEDAYAELYSLGEEIKDPIQITFVDQFDTPEAGIDGGGVTKEFLTSVTAEAFRTEGQWNPMFSSNQQGLLFPNPTAADANREALRAAGAAEGTDQFRENFELFLRKYEFLGRIVGKCLYEGILVDLAFAGFFLLKWPSAGPKEENAYKGSINDLSDLDEELYKGLLRLKNYPGDVSELGFDFTVTDQISPPGERVRTVTRRLIPNGDEVPVTNDNRLLYISYAARHRLVVQPAPQTAAFLKGLRSIVRPSWLSMFNQLELQRLVGGDSSEIDIEDLRRNTVYSGLYEIGDDKEEHPTIKLFWKVMEGFTDVQRRDVMKYVSSTPRAPLLGFSQLRPKFSIRDGGTDEERLPSTSTCVNLLKLPRYTSEKALREKLLYAVSSGAGFHLS